MYHLSMSKFVKTRAFVIKRINYKDADKIIVLYTQNLGKITALAKGIRKMTSKKKSHLELLNLVDIHLVEGRAWYIITQVESKQSFSNLKSTLTNAHYGYYVAEVFEKIVQEEEENGDLFNLLLNTLDKLNKSPTLKTINDFNLKLLELAGYGRKELPVNLDDQELHEYLKGYTEEIIERKLQTNLFI